MPKYVFSEIVVEIVDNVLELLGAFLVGLEEGVGAVHGEVLGDLLAGGVGLVETHGEGLSCALFVFLYQVAFVILGHKVVAPHGGRLFKICPVSLGLIFERAHATAHFAEVINPHFQHLVLDLLRGLEGNSFYRLAIGGL